MNEIFKAIYDRLNAQVAYPVFDHIPQDEQNYPYVRLEIVNTGGKDTDDKVGFSSKIFVHIFSQYRGTKETSDIQLVIFNALNRYKFADTSSYGISGIEQKLQRVIMEKDGITRHGIQEFNIDFEPK